MKAVLVINPGSTSTKMAIFSNNKVIAEETIRHLDTELQQFPTIISQLEFRFNLLYDFLQSTNSSEQLVAVVGRGGLLHPVTGGTYAVDEEMLEDLRLEKYNTHASNLGALLANKFAEEFDIPAFIVDPVVVDELQPLARISGLAGIERRSVAHILNQKAVARRAAQKIGKSYEESTLIVAHLGGGVSVGAHKNGKIIDVVNGIDGEGPYTPERSGSLPLVDFAERVIENQLNVNDVKKLINTESGMKSYLDLTDIREVEKRMNEGDAQAKYYLDGMCYQLGKSISGLAAILKGKVDAIVLTGGIVYSEYVRKQIEEYVNWIALVEFFPGEMEMEALYEGVARVLDGQEEAKKYAKSN